MKRGLSLFGRVGGKYKQSQKLGGEASFRSGAYMGGWVWDAKHLVKKEGVSY
jgi:hypothetical protein